MLSWSWCLTCWSYSGANRPTPPRRIKMLRSLIVMLLAGMLLAQEPVQNMPPAQNPPPAQEEAPDLRIRVVVQHVLAPVLVYDRDGNFVNGLQPDQFHLMDNEKETEYPRGRVLSADLDGDPGAGQLGGGEDAAQYQQDRQHDAPADSGRSGRSRGGGFRSSHPAPCRSSLPIPTKSPWPCARSTPAAMPPT